MRKTRIDFSEMTEYEYVMNLLDTIHSLFHAGSLVNIRKAIHELRLLSAYCDRSLSKIIKKKELEEKENKNE